MLIKNTKLTRSRIINTITSNDRIAPRDFFRPLDDSDTVLRRLSFLVATSLPKHLDLFNDVKDSKERLLNMVYDYPSYTVREAYLLRQFFALFEKNETLNDDKVKLSVAQEAYAKAEYMCRKMNSKSSLIETQRNAGVNEVLYLTQRKISQILGDVPSIDEIDTRFGPGSNTTVSRYTSARFKLQAEPTFSQESVDSITSFFNSHPAYARAHNGNYSIGHGRLTFVPKNAKTFRSIMTEPVCNTMVQLGIGSYIKSRLKENGCDLFDQSRNQRLAQLGSVNNALSTIDLQAASDTISCRVVVDLLPLPWVEFLSAWRTGIVDVRLANGKYTPIQLAKFSTMGNGFTFELESLLFYAIAHSVCSYLSISTDDVSVYGDDIIIPTEATNLLIRVLSHCGFTVNEKKSFTDGPFRESCGKDYLNGFDIRPFYVKEKVSLSILTQFVNFLYRRGEIELRNRVFASFPCLSSVPLGPDGYGDGHIVSKEFQYSLRYDSYETTISSCTNPITGLPVGFTFNSIMNDVNVNKIELPIGDSLIPYYAVLFVNDFDPNSILSYSKDRHYQLRGKGKTKVKKIFVLGPPDR